LGSQWRKTLFPLTGWPYYHLYEINSDGSDLRQLTDGPYDDLEPTYLPDGDIIFCSSRCKRWVPCWSTHVAILYRCDGQGKHIRPISSNIEQENTPGRSPSSTRAPDRTTNRRPGVSATTVSATLKRQLISDARNGFGNRPPRTIGSSASRYRFLPIRATPTTRRS